MKREILCLTFVCFILAASVAILRSHQGIVEPEELSRLIDRADKIVVLQEPWEGSEVLFESSDRHDLDDLKNSLHLERPEKFVHCMCVGTPAIWLFAKGEKIGQITNHHAKKIRCNLWKSDALLVDAEALLRWFDDRNIPGPRKEFQEGLRDKERQVNR